MIDIPTVTGDYYRFDEETGRIFKNGVVCPSHTYEAVYSDVTNRSNPPVFSGIWRKDMNIIITRSGNQHPVSDINSVY